MRLCVFLWCNVASSARHKNPQISPLISLIITSFARPLVHSHMTAKTIKYNERDNYGRLIDDGYNSDSIMADLAK